MKKFYGFNAHGGQRANFDEPASSKEPSDILEYNLKVGEIKTFDVPVLLSCNQLEAGVGVFVQDRAKGISGGFHVVCPNGESNHLGYEQDDLASAFQTILKEFEDKGSGLVGLRAKIAGGSTIFGFGKRNLQSVIEQLARHNIHIDALEVGGESCRTARFHSTNGLLFVQTVGSDFYKIL